MKSILYLNFDLVINILSRIRIYRFIFKIIKIIKLFLEFKFWYFMCDIKGGN